MKRHIFDIAVISAAFLAGCTAEQPAKVAGECDYMFEAISTKAMIGDTCIEWEDGDRIGTFAGTLANNSSEINVGSPCTFNVKSDVPLSVGDMVYAYYPYSVSAGTNAAEVSVCIPAGQTIGTTGFDADAMPQAGVPYVVNGPIDAGTSSPVAGMHFRNLAAVIEFHFYADGLLSEGEKIEKVVLSSTDDICGEYTVDITTAESALVPVGGKGGKAITVTLAEPQVVPATREDAVKCDMIVAPGEFSAVLVIKTDKGEYFKSIDSKAYSANMVKPLSLNIATATKASLSFADDSEVTFAYGEQKEFEIVQSGLVGMDVLGNGWTVELNGDMVSVTAPTREQVSSSGSSSEKTGTTILTLSGTTAIGTEISGTNTKALRLYGLNNAEELAAFTMIYGNTTDTPVTSGLDDYLVDGTICLNADITIPASSVAYNAYWLKRIVLPLDGNGHTLTINTKQAERGGLCQNLGSSVSNLVIEGTMECTGGAGKYIRLGSLADYVSADGITIRNVISNAVIKANNDTNGETIYVGGLVGLYDTKISTPKTVTFENCQFNGSIITTKSVEAVGGILGQASAGAKTYIRNCSCSAAIRCTARGVKGIGGIVGGGGTSTNPGEIAYLQNCSFTGTITYVSDGNYDTRIGGILGNLERGASLEGCSFTGAINADIKNKIYFDSNTRGIGGMIGRDTAPNASFPNMNAMCLMTDCVSRGSITITNCIDTDANKSSHIGQLVGRHLNTSASYQENNCTSESTIVFQ